MIVTAKSVRRTGSPDALHANERHRDAVDTVAGSPTRAEYWFVYILLVATAAIPGLSNKYHLPSQFQIQVFFSVAYVIAGRQLLLMRPQLQPIIRQTAALWTLIALLFASTIWSVAPNVTIVDSIELLGTTLIGIYIAARFSLPQFLRILAIAFATIELSSLVIVFLNPGFGRADWGTGPWQGIFLDKNISGASASLAIISQAVLLPASKGLARWLLLVGILVAGLFLVEANSATAFGDCAVVMVAAIAAFACRSSKLGGVARFTTALIAVSLLAFVAVFGFSVENIYSALGRSSDLTSRADFWPYLQAAIADRPFFGYGYDAFFISPFSWQYLASFIVQAGGWSPYHAHDSFLQTAIDVGYVGLGILVIVLINGLRRAITYFFKERGSVALWPLAIIVFLTIGSYTETYYLNSNSLEWILFVAAVAYPRWPVAAAKPAVGSDGAALSTATAVVPKRKERL